MVPFLRSNVANPTVGSNQMFEDDMMMNVWETKHVRSSRMLTQMAKAKIAIQNGRLLQNRNATIRLFGANL